jgi:hypothetical protein
LNQPKGAPILHDTVLAEGLIILEFRSVVDEDLERTFYGHLVGDTLFDLRHGLGHIASYDPELAL